MSYSQDKLKLKALKKQEAEILQRLEIFRQNCRQAKKRALKAEKEMNDLREKREDAKSDMNTEYQLYSHNQENDFENSRAAYFAADNVFKEAKKVYKTLKLEHKAHQAERDAVEAELNKCKKAIKKISGHMHWRYFRNKVGD